MEDFMETLIEFSTTYGIKVLGAILVLILGRFVAGLARKLVRKGMEKANTDSAVTSFAASMVFYLVIAVAVLAALNNFGVQTASLVAVMGAAAFAVGMAMQGTLANFAAGVMLLVFRPFTIGDFVDTAGVAGTVREIKLFTTVLTTPDNIRVIVPNGKIFGDTIKNISAEDTRRVDMVMGIGYDSSIPKAISIMQEIMAADARVLKDPEPQIAVAELADSSVNLVVRPWVNKADYWGVKFDLTHQFKEAFDREGIEIPFPQRVVHQATA
jgi:small conductance mechanosensitive channel